MTTRVGAGLALLWLVSLPLLTMVRVPIWQDERALWLEATQHSPLKPRPWVNLGHQDHLAGEKEAAERAYRRAQVLSADPRRPLREQQTGWAVATVNLALLMAQRGELENAKGILREVRTKYPRFTGAQRIAQDLGIE
jgi:Flp pilus assembly protein TadD